MNTYEITYIVTSKANEEARDQLNSELEKHIGEMEGKVEYASAALRRQLAYPILDETAGFLRTINIHLDPASIHELQDWLKRNESVIRFTILNSPRREELGVDVIKQLEEQDKRAVKKTDDEPQKDVTMEDVERGIEEALTEEVK